MNTAKATYRTEVHSSKLVIVHHPIYGFISCCNSRQLWDALQGKYTGPEKKPEPKFESVEEFLARGGTIEQVKFPTFEPPPKTPEKPKPDYTKLSLEDLGL